MRLSNKWKLDENLQNLEKRRAIKSLENFVFSTSNDVLCFNKDYYRQKKFQVSLKSVMGEAGCRFPELSVKLL